MEAEIQDYAETLNEDGIVIIDNYLDESTCEELYEEISREIEEGGYDVVEGGDHEYGYNDFANWGSPVVNKRSGRDEGMLDVFNVDMAVSEVASFKSDEMVNNIINRATSEGYSPDNLNVYWNRSVTTTRDFHADTYGGKFKSFVYLTDVPNQSFGPFSYVKGSHQSSKIKNKTSSIVNRIKDKPSTDAVFYDKDDITYCTAPKGTLIIANQAGYHRGQPQEDGKERMLMTTSYTPTN
ncbi:hypothetical protein ACERIT_13375 [Halopenitus sp. H-Gu1]|uniref:hypothetical protein n=1 Tax=Halopenitus sp. H-Gu1 TaxID=3242697 RepID=UPI00359E7A08